MRLLTWNIRHGGGYRVAAIADWLGRCAADVMVLTEARGTAPSQRLRGALAERGFEHQVAATVNARANGVLIASRRPLRHDPLPRGLRHDSARAASVRCGELRIVGLYFPATAATIRPYFDAVLAATPRWLAGDTVLLGDFNSGQPALDCQRPFAFTGASQFDALLEQGWVDGWRARHGTRREYTWYSHTGNGFRIDHAFLSPTVAPRLQRARYAHTVRAHGLSDHSALVIEIAE